MGSFQCSECGGEYHLPRRTTFVCPNCNIDLSPVQHITPPVQQADGWTGGSLGEPVEYLVPPTVGPVEEEFGKVMGRATTLWLDRQKKYGPTNIAATGALGCFVRATDKLARLREVYINSRGTEVTDETVVDSWLDLLNYAAMGLMCHEGTWPGAR